MAFSLIERWLAGCPASPDGVRIESNLSDLTDVIRGVILGIPVDEAWYLNEYNGVREYLAADPTGTVAMHFRKHGYFEGRIPFQQGWGNKIAPPSFSTIMRRFEVTPGRGGIRLRFERNEFLGIITSLLSCAEVSGAWYRARYPDADKALNDGLAATPTAHFAEVGYFRNYLPREVKVDEAWYLSQYRDVAEGVAAGRFASAKLHFEMTGYGEGRLPGNL